MKLREQENFLKEQGYEFSTGKINNNSEERVWIFEKIN